MLNEDYTLEVPNYVSLEKELTPGLSVKNFAICTLITVAILILLLIIKNAVFNISGIKVIIISAVVFFIGTALLTKSKSSHLTMIDFLTIVLKFNKQPKYYPFIFERGVNDNVQKDS